MQKIESSIDLLPYQEEFLFNPTKFLLLCGGIGSGKSFIGSHYVINKCANDGKGQGLITANTYKQLRNSTLACLFVELDKHNISYEYKEQKGHLKIMNTNIITASLEHYDTLRGIEISWFWADEVRDTKLNAFLVLCGRLRDKRSKIEGRLTSSPSGFNWLYDYWVGEKKSKEHELIKAKSTENIHLPKEYITTLMDSYDSQMYAQEVEAEFLSLNQGAVYYAFKRESAVMPVADDLVSPLWIGLDFNINPLCGAISTISGDGTIKVIDEIHIMSSNTHEVAQYIKDKYPGRTVNIVPDATGRALKTSAAGLSDHNILRNAGFNVLHTTNPFRMDRYNAVNNALEKNHVMVDNKCTHLIKDLERVSYKEGTNLPDTSTNLTHISDALGYLIFYLKGRKRIKVEAQSFR